MDSLFSCEVSSSSTINYPCGCLNLRLSNVERDHVMSCPKPYTYTTPFDFVRYIRNPATFHSSKSEIQGQSQIVSTDPFNQYNTENVMRKDPGLVRIDQYMAVLNYIRQNVQGCTVFYTVTDRLLKHMFAQLLPIIVGDERYNMDPAKYHSYAELKAVPVRSFITTARQIGKTTTMAIAVAALLCVADGMDLCKIYARTQNQAVNLLSELKSIFFRLPLSLRPKEILKQNEGSPLPVEEQVAIIYIGTKGLCSKVPVKEMKAFEEEFLEYMRSKHSDVLGELKAGKLTDNAIKAIESAAAELTAKH